MDGVTVTSTEPSVGATCTDTFADAAIALLLHVSEKFVVAARAGTVKLPLTSRDPLHPPDAVHEVAFVDDQVRVVDSPACTLVGYALSVTVGGLGGGEDVEPPLPPPPHPATRTKPRHDAGRAIRNAGLQQGPVEC